MSPQRDFFSFGPFVLDPVEYRLLRAGQPVALTRKAFQVLAHLVEHHGQLVTREQLLERVWGDVAVDDAVVTVNVSAVRRALGDDRNGHTFVETVPRAGYRFVAPVSRLPAAPSVAIASERPRRISPRLFVAVALVAAVAVSTFQRVFRNDSPPPLTNPVQRQITANPLANPVARGSISPDGRYFAYSDLLGIHILLIGTGATRLIPPPPGYCFR